MNAVQTLIAVTALVLLGEFFADLFAKNGTWIVELIMLCLGFSVFFKLRKSRK